MKNEIEQMRRFLLFFFKFHFFLAFLDLSSLKLPIPVGINYLLMSITNH